MCLNMTMLEMEHVNMFSFKQRNIVTEKVTIEFGSVKKRKISEKNNIESAKPCDL